jgi:hypothetical protein
MKGPRAREVVMPRRGARVGSALCWLALGALSGGCTGLIEGRATPDGAGSQVAPSDAGPAADPEASAPDAAPPAGDGGLPPLDASPSDGAAIPQPDAGPPQPDAGPPQPDASPPQPDASPPQPDASPPQPDAAPPPPDAAPPPPDAGPPQPDGGAILPVVDFARPGGGSWTLSFHDDFDGTGGTTAEAMSGANFRDRTVGGGALPGNPGLNPRKWNMGWWTGPSSLTGLGEVTRSTAWGSSQTQWWGAESLVFPGDSTIRLRSQRRSWNGYDNEMGMITTAGLYACNPASSSHGSVPADRFVDGPQIVEWQAAGTFIVDWPAMWMTNGGNFGSAGSQWPGGSSYREEIDLVEPIFRLHAASEFQAGKRVVPTGWNGNDLLTWTWFFDAARIILWVTNESGATVQMFDIPDSEVSASMISAQWSYPQYLMFAQQSKVADTADGDMAIHYVRIWN